MVRPGYKQTEVGVIPEDWNAVPIGEMFTFKNGLNKAKEFFGYGTPIVNYMDVFGRPSLRVIDVAGRVDVNSRELASYEVKKGDVFFTRTSETVDEIGVASVMLDEAQKTVFSGFVLRARPSDESLDDGFKAYCFSPSYFRQQVTSRASYTTRALTNGRSLSAALLARPPLPEQRAIAAALADVDAALAGVLGMIAKKQDLKQAAMQTLLTGQTRLPGFSGDWVVRQLGEVVGIRNQKVNTLGADIAAFCIELEQIGQNSGRIESYLDARDRQTSKYIFKAGDVLFGRLRPYLRKYWSADREGVCSTEIWPLVPLGANIVPSYLFQTVQTDSFIEAANSSYGTHMPRCDWGALKLHELSVPPSLAEQTAIADVLSGMDAEIVALSAQADKIRQLKQGMMQDLLTGRVRLPLPEVTDA